ncbi:MAG: hypothetical protein JJT96_09680 [Opitutales bacterium]|nr:hypothetical protein [Opitutales bacterium]
MGEGFFTRLRKALFGEKPPTPPRQPELSRRAEEKERKPEPRPSRPQVIAPAAKSGRDPLVFQVGFDFGTAYSKCIVRDINLNKAWVFVPPGSGGHELPFLLPSRVAFDGTAFTVPGDHDLHYGAGLLTHLKMVWAGLESGAKDQTANTRYIAQTGRCSEKGELRAFAKSSILYLLGGWLGAVKTEIRRRYPDFGRHPDDQIAVNMAIPVADAKEHAVRTSFERLLILAWNLADDLAGHPPIKQIELTDLIRGRDRDRTPEGDELCFVYPEVSANVQGFIRSRVSSPGLYLFSDAGAGTVDQSVFLFSQNNGPAPFLAYLAAQVHALGSSRIDQHAALAEGRETPQRFEYWRKQKESGASEPLLLAARKWVHAELGQRSVAPLAIAKRKLFQPKQLTKTQLIFGGGGHTRDPYETGVVEAFSHPIFGEGITPAVLGMPNPQDLELPRQQDRWLLRLSVAYGLSFTPVELAGFDYPEDNPDQTHTRSTKLKITAPTKDDC